MTQWHIFCTPEYRGMGEETCRQLAAYGIQPYLVDYASTRNWDMNCLARPQMLLDRMHGDEAVGLLDAELCFLAEPTLMKCWSGDVLVHKTGDDVPSRVYSAGIVAFRGSVGRKVLTQWAELCLRHSMKGVGLPEQYYIWAALQKNVFSPCWLPFTYCHVPPRGHENDPVPKGTIVVHLPASRILKAAVNTACAAGPQASPTELDSLNAVAFPGPALAKCAKCGTEVVACALTQDNVCTACVAAPAPAEEPKAEQPKPKKGKRNAKN